MKSRGPDKITCRTIIKNAKEARALELARTPLAYEMNKGDVRDDLFGDGKPDFMRGDLQDPKSLKNVAIFLVSESVMPWRCKR